MIETPSSEQPPPPPSKPPDEQNGGESCDTNMNSAGVQTRARSNPSCSGSGTTMSTSTKYKEQPSQIPIKKKTVTFKVELETNDDNIIKKVYNPMITTPLVPIIKKECLSRTSRLLKNECIVRPSRLTEILKNNENNIDKLNSITFRSVPKFSSSGINNSTLSTSLVPLANNIVLGDKRFILPKRSVHSCRVIKPNKRFLDGVENGEDVNKQRMEKLAKEKKLFKMKNAKKLEDDENEDVDDDDDEEEEGEEEEEDEDDDDEHAQEEVDEEEVEEDDEGEGTETSGSISEGIIFVY